MKKTEHLSYGFIKSFEIFSYDLRLPKRKLYKNSKIEVLELLNSKYIMRQHK